MGMEAVDVTKTNQARRRSRGEPSNKKTSKTVTKTRGQSSGKQNRSSNDRVEPASKEILIRETRKKARVDYREVNYNMVDYTEMDNDGEVQASGIMQDGGTVKDARRKAESEKKSRSKE